MTSARRLVSVSAIGRMAGISKQGAWNLMDQRTHPTAPDPEPGQEVGGGRSWDRGKVAAYLLSLGREKTWED